jgi:hypothetical protein
MKHLETKIWCVINNLGISHNKTKAPRIWKFVLGVRNLGKSDMDRFIPIESKLESKQHTLPIKRKCLMLQNFAYNHKMANTTCLKYDQQYAYH